MNYAWEKDPTGMNFEEQKQRIDYIKKNGLAGYGFRRNKNIVPNIENLCISKNQEIVIDYDIPEYISKVTQYKDSYVSYSVKLNGTFNYDTYKAFARRNKMESITCQVFGSENYRMASSVF